MIRIQVKQTRTVRFKEEAKEFGEGEVREYLLLAIFPPRDYPSWTLTMLSPDGERRVRKTFQEGGEAEEELKKWARQIVNKPCRAYVVVKKVEGAFEFELRSVEDEAYTYEKKKGGLLLTKLQTEQDDIPF